MAWTHILGLLLLLASGFATTYQTCADIDPIACQTMSEKNIEMCADPTLSKTACPKFCNLCAMQCYQCTTTFDAHHLCTTTKTCAADEVCMKKEVTSVVDGHHEYQLSCEPKNRCDGRDLLLNFGKRELNARDLSISCCYKDLCNSINGTATPHWNATVGPIQVCKKDVTVVIENSERSVPEVSLNDVKKFLVDVVSGLSIGQDTVLMSVAKFSEHAHTLWDLDTYPDKANLTNAIDGLTLLVDHDHSEVHTAMSYVLSHEHGPGYRTDAGDVIIIITDEVKGGLSTEEAARKMNAHFNDVIVIGIDDDIHDGHDVIHFATDNRHEFYMFTSRKMHRIVQKVISLICQ